MTLPNLSAGCSMADMANIDQVQECWDQLGEICGTEPDSDDRQQIIPVTYMNSSAALKAFCGRNGGIVCTSSNAHAVLEWAFARGKRVLFFPDQHLGRNTARAMGVPLSEMPLWDPFKAQGGASDPADYARAKMILWKGFCSVHQRFTVEQIERARKAYPGVKVIVHPECSMQVVDAADGTGSTAYIVKEIANAPAGSAIAVGTEINLVNRLAAQYPDKTVFCLDPVVCPCSTMYRIHPAYLAWALENLEQGNVVNRIIVDDDTAREAKVALSACCAFTRDLSPAPAGGSEPKTEESNTMSNVEIVVVGAGVAGLSAALAVAGTGHDVTLVTKTELVESNTYHAQGGIAAAIFSDDDPKLHAADTMAAGHGLCDPKAVDILTREGADRVREFAAAGVHFDRDAQGHMLRGLEAAHSRARVVHAGETPQARCLSWTSPPWCVRIRVSISSNMPSSKTLSCVTAVLPASGC